MHHVSSQNIRHSYAIANTMAHLVLATIILAILQVFHKLRKIESSLYFDTFSQLWCMVWIVKAESQGIMPRWTMTARAIFSVFHHSTPRVFISIVLQVFDVFCKSCSNMPTDFMTRNCFVGFLLYFYAYLFIVRNQVPPGNSSVSP